MATVGSSSSSDGIGRPALADGRVTTNLRTRHLRARGGRPRPNAPDRVELGATGPAQLEPAMNRHVRGQVAQALTCSISAGESPSGVTFSVVTPDSRNAATRSWMKPSEPTRLVSSSSSSGIRAAASSFFLSR